MLLNLLKKKGTILSVTWLHRNDRFAEKLATPDVTVADIIGDVDPIKAANLKLSYADDRVIHYGMIPEPIAVFFVINELPDLQARIQVALFNILQEGDVQIRGFKLRLNLDMQFVFLQQIQKTIPIEEYCYSFKGQNWISNFDTLSRYCCHSKNYYISRGNSR